ncbi:thiamine ABC transporter ATP-binding protein [Gellertiella hungarica]|nr:ATP-binding cassette domain-containing protein [Gellertiella hungarica]
MSDDKPHIHMDNVRLDRGGQTFHIDVRMSGSITAVAGASGSGKTTFLHLIAGFETPRSGRILLTGKDVTDLHPADRPVSLVFQDNNLFAHLDIARNVGLGINPSLRLTAEDERRIDEALARTGLAGYGGRLPGTLSGGERQRAAFARALVRKRPYLLLDEPFAALDPGLRLAMGDLLRELQAETGVMVVMVTHLPDEVERLAERVVFLARGTVVASGPTDEILRRGMLPEIDAFMG